MGNLINEKEEKLSGGQEKIVILPKEKRYIMVVDEETQEIKGCFPLKKRGLGKGWIALYQNPSIWLARQHFTGEQARVIFFLFGKLDFENYLRVSREEIAEGTDLQPVNVSRAMKRLKELEIIIAEPPAGKFKTYRLNPYIAHKGEDRQNTIEDFNAALKEKQKNQTNE